MGDACRDRNTAHRVWIAIEALMRAKANLEVTVERMILAALNWPVDHSNVSASYLTHNGWTGNKDLAKQVKILAEASISPGGAVVP